ncbi:efflux RND transporter permease subunit [Pseudoteredinibacter isoporae]|uniref:efflux RND transporter permease subunit n=1 Tax=Pseudoteredinibacter isoporae TaxID=570281 RepID=UPI00310AF1A7
MKHRLMQWSFDHPKRVFWATGLLCLLALVMFPRLSVDTDPENMLPHQHPARVLHEEIKQRFGLSDMVVLGIVNERHAQGIYNARSLWKLAHISEAALAMEGVIDEDVMSLSLSDNITQGTDGEIAFHWMMRTPPVNDEAAEQIARWIKRLPLLNNTLVSDDQKAAALYIPIVAKDQSYRIYQQLLSVIEELPEGDEQFYITGLPVAEDTFGVEMFKQMAISAPAAGLLIFALMLFFFRSLALVAAPMIVAMATVIITMGAMIGLGFPVHIMSSMIPIFLMPIAVVDSVHLLSEFNDHYRPGMDKTKLAREVVEKLFQPMLFTSITSMVGFASLNTADIPPVRVFGSFVALGIGVAFLLSITLVPAYISSLSDKTLAAMARRVHSDETPNSPLARMLRLLPQFSHRFRYAIIATAIGSLLFSVVGIHNIQINDNPMNWFESEHPIRKADRTLNQHFAGTYEAYLSFSAQQPQENHSELKTILERAPEHIQSRFKTLQANSNDIAETLIDQQMNSSDDDLLWWDDIALAIDRANDEQRLFLQPEYLQYLENVQKALIATGHIGKTNGLVDLLKTVNRELHGGDTSFYQLPDSSQATAQALLTFQSSHRPGDVWHFVTPDYRSSVIWLQLSSGDNQDMSAVLEAMDRWFDNNPPPAGLDIHWSGLTYINVAWQEAMVSGMLESLLSSFVIVAVMMMVLFRSIGWGLIAMLPLSITISLIYGLIGFSGKNYDMPVAVLSALTLGMSIDFAIHFIERCRALMQHYGNWSDVRTAMFEEPGRAISRNAIVIALGFTPLLLAPLVPYQTVGLFLASIMVISCISSLLLIPSIISVLNNFLFAPATLKPHARGELTHE